MHDHIRIATKDLAEVLSRHRTTLGSQRWTTHVEDQLTYPQRQRVQDLQRIQYVVAVNQSL